MNKFTRIFLRLTFPQGEADGSLQPVRADPAAAAEGLEDVVEPAERLHAHDPVDLGDVDAHLEN